MQRSVRDLYLETTKRTLTRYGFPEAGEVAGPPNRVAAVLWRLLQRTTREPLRLVRETDSASERRKDGRDWPAHAETMVGLRRLDNIRSCIESVLEEGVPGDLVETGVWRGGAAIYMRAVLAAHGVSERTVWVADSFQGLPPPDVERYPEEADPDPANQLWQFPHLAVSRDDVEEAFRRYGLLDDQVCFLEGWFHETLPDAPIDEIAVLRLDGDLYSSTMDVLRALYDRVSPGGYVIVDDYGSIEACRRAVADFRSDRDLDSPIEEIDWTGAYWRVPG